MNAREHSVLGVLAPFPQAVDDRGATSWTELEPFRIETEAVRDQAIVTPVGELDLATAGSLQRLLIALEAGNPAVIVCDLGELSFMDCSGLRVLLEAATRARHADRQLKVLCGAGQVGRLLSVLNADQQLDIAEHRAQSRTPCPRTTTS